MARYSMACYGMMTPYEILSPGATTSLPDTSICNVAHTTSDEDSGPITVLVESGEPVGVVTERDTTAWFVARGWNPLEATAPETLSEGAAVAWADDVAED